MPEIGNVKIRRRWLHHSTSVDRVGSVQARVLVCLLLAEMVIGLAACGSSSSSPTTSSPTTSGPTTSAPTTSTSTVPVPTTSTSTTSASNPAAAQDSADWVEDSVHALNVFLPDADSIYWFDGYGTAEGARTVVRGQVPRARYWSFTAYPFPPGSAEQHVHDTEIAQSDGRYSVTVSDSCSGVAGTCLSMGSGGGRGVLVMRLYVPVDFSTSGTGGVPLPSIGYLSASGASVTLAQASGSKEIAQLIAGYRAQHGALPAALTRAYPPAAPVPVPVVNPHPIGVISQGDGPFANPDNVYEHIRYTTARGNLVVSALAPTYQADSFPTANDLARSASQAPQVRYWSLCVVLKGRHTGACLRDAQVHLQTGSGIFTAIVAPTCPVAGYANCIEAGPEPLQNSLSYRNLLPSPGFAPLALTGPYRLTATYVARPG